MKNRNKLLVSIITGLTLAGCSANTVDTNVSKGDEIFLNVDGSEITNSEYNKSLLNQLTYAATLDALDLKVLEAKYSTDPRVATELSKSKDEFFKTYDSESKQKMQYELVGANNYDEYVSKSSTKLDAYKNVAVMDYAYDNVYSQDEKQYAYDYKIELTGNYSMILVAPSITSTSTQEEIVKAQADALKKAEEINAKITDKATFESAAKESSDDKISGANGGNIGQLTRSSAKEKGLSQSFINEAFKLEKDTFTKKPIETEFGYVIIYCNETDKKSFDESKELISEALFNVYSTENTTFEDYVMVLFRESNKLEFNYGTYSSSYAQNSIQTKLQYRQNSQNSYGY